MVDSLNHRSHPYLWEDRFIHLHHRPMRMGIPHILILNSQLILDFTWVLLHRMNKPLVLLLVFHFQTNPVIQAECISTTLKQDHLCKLMLE
jgi:hypothetical protein